MSPHYHPRRHAALLRATALAPRLGLLVECISELETTDKSDGADRSSGQSYNGLLGSAEHVALQTRLQNFVAKVADRFRLDEKSASPRLAREAPNTRGLSSNSESSPAILSCLAPALEILTQSELRPCNAASRPFDPTTLPLEGYWRLQHRQILNQLPITGIHAEAGKGLC